MILSEELERVLPAFNERTKEKETEHSVDFLFETYIIQTQTVLGKLGLLFGAMVVPL